VHGDVLDALHFLDSAALAPESEEHHRNPCHGGGQEQPEKKFRTERMPADLMEEIFHHTHEPIADSLFETIPGIRRLYGGELAAAEDLVEFFARDRIWRRCARGIILYLIREVAEPFFPSFDVRDARVLITFGIDENRTQRLGRNVVMAIRRVNLPLYGKTRAKCVEVFASRVLSLERCFELVKFGRERAWIVWARLVRTRRRWLLRLCGGCRCGKREQHNRRDTAERYSEAAASVHRDRLSESAGEATAK